MTKKEIGMRRNEFKTTSTAAEGVEMAGKSGRSRRGLKAVLPFLVVLVAAFAFAGGAGAMVNEATNLPWIQSDQADYAAGSTVHLTGGNWQPDETVTVSTNDSVGSSWSQTDTVTVDSAGNLTDDVVLPNSLIAVYSVTATGSSGDSATATFTDAASLKVAGSDNTAGHDTAANEESLGSVVKGTTLALSCPRGTGLTTSVTGNGNSTVNWSLAYVSGAEDNATLSGKTTLTPSSGSFSGNLQSCVALSITTSALTAGTTYHGQLRLAASGASSADYFFAFTVNAAADTTPPVITPTVTPTTPNGSSGWYSSGNVTVSFAVSDPDSTVTARSAACTTDTTTTTVNTDGTTAVTCTATSGGGTSSNTQTIKRDTTNPAVAITSPSNGSSTSAATITVSGTDSDTGGSGVASVAVGGTGATLSPGTFSLTNYGLSCGSNTINALATDVAGNTAPASVTVTRVCDTTPPVITKVITGTAGSNGWYTSNVSVAWTVTDAQSAVVIDSGCGTQNFTSETTGTTSSCSAHSDGGPSSDSVSLKIDKTGPSAALAVTAGTLGAHGWYTSDVTVSASGADAVSGGVTCTADQSQTTETSGHVFDGSCTNDAGLSTGASSLTVKLDKTGPSAALAVTAGTLGAHGWYTSNVTVSASGADAVSGGVTCTADQHQTTETTGHVFDGSCTNDAGLSTGASSLTVKLDKTGPSAALAVTAGTLGANGWYTSNVTVGTSGSDSISDPTTCTADQSQTTETSGHVFDGSCTNDAGLSTGASPLTVKLDKTAPLISDLGPTPAAPNGLNSWYTTDVSNAFKATDATSGLNAACLSAFPVNGSGDNVQSKTTGGEGAALHVTSTGCTDLAGNAATGKPSASFMVDLTNPVVTCPASPTFLASQLPQTITAAVTDTALGSGAVAATAIGTANNPSGGSVSITGYDNAGRSSAASCAYHVGNTSFVAPIDKAPIMNIAKLGRVVPVKVTFTYDAVPITTTGTVYVGGMSQVSCTDASGGDVIDAYAAGSSNSGNLFRWDSTGPFWIYNFDTSAFAMKAGNCYRINVYYGGAVSGSTGSGGNLVGYFLMQTTK
jgi:hypothetical protein